MFVLWTTNTIISFVFPLLREAVGATPTFGLFVLINIVSVILVGKFVPETRGRRSWRSWRTISACTTGSVHPHSSRGGAGLLATLDR
ncbi:MAG: MFS transporter [Mycobacterium leprae]